MAASASFVPIATSGQALVGPELSSKSTIASMIVAAANALASIAPVDPPLSTMMFASTYAYLVDSKDWGAHWVLCVNCLVMFEQAHSFSEVIFISLHVIGARTDIHSIEE